MKNWKITVLLCMAFVLVNMTTSAQEFEKIDALPEVFGEGAVSTSNFEFNATFSPDGNRVYFTKASRNWAFMTIVYSDRRGNGKWSVPKIASFSGQYRDADPFVSPDGSKLLFISNRPLEGQEVDGQLRIWAVERQGERWGEPRIFTEALNDFSPAVYPSISRNGNLYFSGRKSDGTAGMFFAEFDGEDYLTPQKIAVSKQGDIDPIVSADERLLFFVSRTRQGVGGGDLYVSRKANSSWSEPLPLSSPVNSPFSEGQPGISSDNQRLFFTSNRTERHSPDIASAYRAKKLGSYKELVDELEAVANGRIYSVDISELFKD